MKLESCPKCSKELIFLQSSGRYICRTCGTSEQQNNEETEQLKDFEAASSPETVVKSEVIPVEIEVVGSQSNKSVGWSTAGVAAGALIAGPMGAIIGLATQGNGQKFH
jgi:DNA-directed RNA polymerase subunit M/transcription elongation factor TFIIS